MVQDLNEKMACVDCSIARILGVPEKHGGGGGIIKILYFWNKTDKLNQNL
jgi:hypothetical protein